MDLYLFYNCINNLNEVLNTPNNELTLRHKIMINDPLVFNFYLNNLKKIPFKNMSAGAAVAAKAGAGKGAAKPGNPQNELAKKKLDSIKKKEEEDKKKKR